MFDLDDDVRRAEGPPREFYTDTEWLKTQQSRLFAPSWQWLPSESLAVADGEARGARLLPGCLDEPLAITRERGTLRCLSNVCTHRGHAVVTEARDARGGLRCPYHGRRFGLDGRLRSMPFFEGVEGFPSERDDLTNYPMGALGSITFASLAPRVSFDEWIAPVRARVPSRWVDALVEDTASARTYVVDGHWALYCENYLEGLHIPFLHAGLSEAIDVGDYRYELTPHGVLQIGISRDLSQPAFVMPDGHPEAGERVAAWYFWLMPNTMVNVYPWGISLNVVVPTGLARTEVHYRSYVADPSLRTLGAGGALDRVEREDQSAVRSVQANLRARGWRRGRYSPLHELGTHHFHRLARDWMR